MYWMERKNIQVQWCVLNFGKQGLEKCLEFIKCITQSLHFSNVTFNVYLLAFFIQYYGLMLILVINGKYSGFGIDIIFHWKIIAIFLNTLRLRPDDCKFPDDIFNAFF